MQSSVGTKRLNYDFSNAFAVENLASAESMGGASAGMGPKQKQIPRWALVAAYMFVGLLFIIGTPIAFYSYPVVNYDVIAIGIVFGLIIIGAAFWDWMGVKSMKRNIAPYVMLVLGIISVFLFSYTFSTPWVATYHLYIFPIDLSNTSATYIPSYVAGAANPSEYNVQNYVSAISTMGGLITVISSLYEITLVRKMPKM